MNHNFFSIAAPGARTLQPYQPGKPESELRREYGLSDIVKLASNENPLGPSPKGLAAVREALAGLARYPDGNGFELKAALSERLGVPMAALTLGNGSNDVLELVARAFLTPEHEAIFSEHAFAVYPIVTQAIGATARVAKANPPDHEMPYGHDLAAMRSLVNDRTRVAFIANPNNPTGTWLKTAELEGFLKSMPEQVIVVVDEAYFEYVEPVLDCPDALKWLGHFPNLVVTRTFSKAYGLAGLRVGYAVSDPQVADLLNRVREPFNVNSLALAAATAALDDAEHLENGKAVNRAGMANLLAFCRQHGLNWLPSAGNFLCIDVGRPGREVYLELLKCGVITRPVDNYGLPRFLRISIGTEAENARLLAALAEVLNR
ncbi:Histidinol-phosphate aminotransferase 2 [Candidatus Competibacter denitrificans Run_A_D11]|uniref:Histidinol-phosphate aminotransferase n=1 Tax=Candidatus Competibacter denitrificans Run_A_D11 TaxID=1400863 RepID=W6ME94_9GAMM|nr:histidinol-phosphate transaminase [Candidatus Competibacter denitrificans]CDI04218.1 Histidinol-phosphate aminotransferase 2 [Candidatus Competibacter denitrificans Run_A_D11]HAS87438.1 histidinol-phosphate transaminase [Candidatus Competibacteraceae bacterium]HRC68682.1 histidinol-phosphate transaminase [Candidatus Competibacter denitrificans]